jgi:electron transport complex protein RnfB
MDRRHFLKWTARGAGVVALTAITSRLVYSNGDNKTSHAFRIDTNKCTFCGKCETACLRRPSAVRAVNDQSLCSKCVICYGHVITYDAKGNPIHVKDPDSAAALKVCPHGAIQREPLDNSGRYRYTIVQAKCTGCGRCAKDCNLHGSKSMFLLLRPDLCMGCNHCAIVAACPESAISRVEIGPDCALRPPMEEDMGGEW